MPYEEEQQLIGPQVVCSVFIKKHDNFLITYCPRFKTWRLPSGRPHTGEKIIKALLREMNEELHIELKNPEFLDYGEDDAFHYLGNFETHRLIMFFLCKIEDYVKLEGTEAEKYQWVTWEQLKKHENLEVALQDFFKKNPEIKL